MYATEEAIRGSLAEERLAFTHQLKQWDALSEYCRNGWVEIDNNLCENTRRVVALGGGLHAL